MSWPARGTSGQIKIPIRSTHFNIQRTLAQTSSERNQTFADTPLTTRGGVVHSAGRYLGRFNEPGVAVWNRSSHAGRYSPRKLRRSHEADVRVAMGKQLVAVRAVWTDRISLDYQLCHRAECH